MRTGNVAEVYEWVVQDVVTKVQELFGREGVDPAVLHELRTLWTTKLRKEQVYGREEDNVTKPGSQHLTQPRIKAEEVQRLTSKGPLASQPTGVPTSLPGVVPRQQGPPIVLGMPQQGTQPFGQHGGARYSIPSGAVTPMCLQPGIAQVPQAYGPVAPMPSQSSAGQTMQGTHAPDQIVHRTPAPAGLKEDAGLPAAQGNLRPEAPVGTVSEDDAAGKGGADESVKRATDASGQTGVKIEPTEPADIKPEILRLSDVDGEGNGVSGPDRKTKQCKEGLARNGATNGAHSTDAGEEPLSKVQRINGKSAPEDRAVKRESGCKDEDEDEDEDLPTDEDDDDMEDPPNFLTAQYEKVSRIKNRWRCQLKYGIFHANGKDYLFKNATGDFTF